MYPAKRLSSADVHIHLGIILPYLLLQIFRSVTSASRCPQLNPHSCTYRGQHLKTFNGLPSAKLCQSLDLSDSNLTSIGNVVFIDFTNLLSLDMSHNNIAHLEPEAFCGLFQLTCLDLNGNPFSYTKGVAQVFSPLLSLKVLDIGQGGRCVSPKEYRPDLAMSSLVSLEELYMDMYHQVPLGKFGFSKLTHLKTISAEGHCCDIGELLNDTFKVFENSTVITLNVAKCKVRNIEQRTFSHFHHLENLIISGNDRLGLTSAMRSLAGLVGRNMTLIEMSQVNFQYSKISDLSLTKDKFKYLKDICVKSLDISNNMVIQFDAEVLDTFRYPNCLEEIRFKNFYLQLSVMEKLYYYGNSFRNLRHFDMSGSRLRVRASMPKSTELTEGIRFAIFLPALLNFVNASGCWLSCSSDIYFRNGSHLHTLDLSYVGFAGCARIKFHGIDSVEVLNVSGNDLADTNEFLNSFPSLTTLIARETNLEVPFRSNTCGNMLNRLVHLRYLDLSNSGITSIPRSLLKKNVDLQTLILSYNKLSDIPESIYSTNRLRKVDMRFNVMPSVVWRDRTRLDALVESRGNFTFYLEGNPFSCNCETLEFVEWIASPKVRLDKDGNYNCVVQNGSWVPVQMVISTLREHTIQCVSSYRIVFSTLAVSLFIVSLLAAAVGYRYRVPITYWCITICKKPDAKPEKRHKYDALVAYCQEDYEWVCHTLQPTLEQDGIQFSYKLCLYDRDFIPGLTIEENVVNATNSSFKTVLVITPAFLRSQWCHFEVQMARMKMFHEGREDVIIPVILRDVPVVTMPKTLLNLWNTSVFLVWSDSPAEQRHFWVMLISALGPARVCNQATMSDDHHVEDIPVPNRGLKEILEMNEQQPLLSSRIC